MHPDSKALGLNSRAFFFTLKFQGPVEAGYRRQRDAHTPCKLRISLIVYRSIWHGRPGQVGPFQICIPKIGLLQIGLPQISSL